jgi:hypothetical protein
VLNGDKFQPSPTPVRPIAVTYFGYPAASTNNIKPNLGLYAQDQWAVRRLTLNAGLRFDFWRSGFPDQTVAPTEFVPVPRSVSGQTAVSWKDLSPRVGGTYDLFGSGRTVLKASVNRYVLQETVPRANTLNPILNNNSDTRQWTDANGDFVVQGDPRNQAANEELGPSTNLNFGRPVSTTSFDPDWAFGYGKRPDQWETSVGINQQVIPRMAVAFSYFRRVYGNFSATENRAVSASDYSPYCVTVPVDPRLPTAGQSICGLFDLNANRVGRIANVVTSASKYGKQYEHWTGFDFTTTARLARLLLQGGVSAGKTTADNCDIVTRNPQVVSPAPSGSSLIVASGPSTSTAFCHLEDPVRAQVKLLGSYTLPWDVRVAATLQSIPGPQVLANTVFTSAQIAPSLGRPLAATATATVNVVRPGTLFVERMNQIDLRVGKRFHLHGAELEGNIELYNVLNANDDLVLNSVYGTTGAVWRQPLVILPPSLAKFSVQYTF